MHEPNGLTPMFNVGDRVTLKQLSHAHIRYWLEETGSVKEAAKILGMHPGSLSREKIQWTKNAHRASDTDRSSAHRDWQDSRATSDDAASSTDD